MIGSRAGDGLMSCWLLGKGINLDTRGSCTQFREHIGGLLCLTGALRRISRVHTGYFRGKIR